MRSYNSQPGMEDVMIRSWLKVIPPVLLITLAAGCAKPPKDELARVEKAVGEARTNMVDMYNPKKFNEYVQAYEEAKKLVEAKKFDEARKSLEDVEKKLAELADTSMKLREKMKEEAESELPKVQDEVAAAKKKFDESAAKLDDEAQKAGRTTFENVQETLGEIKKAMEAGQYWGLKGKLAQIRKRIEEPTRGMGGGHEQKAEKGEKANGPKDAAKKEKPKKEKAAAADAEKKKPAEKKEKPEGK